MKKRTQKRTQKHLDIRINPMTKEAKFLRFIWTPD